MVSYTIVIVAIFSILTNCIFLILLVRWKSIRLGIFSSLLILAASDILCDLILPIILLTDQFYVTSYYRFHNENEATNMTPTKCNFGSVLWYYTLFLVPLFNTFIPLLSKSLHCLYYTKCIETKWDEFMLNKSNIISLKQSSTTLESLKLNKNIHKITIFCVICQWVLLPIFITILYTTEHQQSNLPSQSYNSIPCMHMMDLPFNNCYSKRNDNSEIKFSNAKLDNTNISLSNIHKDYMMNYNSTELLSSLTDKIILRLHDIVQSIRNIPELMINQSTIHCYSQFTNNRTIIKPENPTFNEPVKPNKGINLLIQDQLHTYIRSMDINMIIANSERHAYENCFDSRYIIPVNLCFPIFIIYIGSICLSIISYVKCRHINLRINGKSEATNLMKIMTKIGISPGNSALNRSSNAKLVADKDNYSQCHDHQSNSNEGQSQCNIKQANITEKLVLTFWTTILLAVFLWTPLLLHILAQMMFCYQIPNWLTDISYSVVMTSLIIRNISNIFMIKWRKLPLKTWMKHNRKIHPISSLSA